jgi:AcrR family transcriptional regulator
MPKNLNNIREDILSVTRNLIKETGYSDLNIRKIASECGVATGTVYNYYSSKNQIIGEILLNEWNLMLRRIDQNTKVVPEIIDKLEIMFNELSNFMINVHGAWFQTHPVNNKLNMDVSRIKEKNKILRNQISERICLFFSSDHIHEDEVMSVCDVMAHILISYCNDNVEFSKLRLSLMALSNEINRLV